MNETMPLVSVIMPTYNSIKYIESAIESVLNQSYHHLELIIVNDGSTDNTDKLILSIKDKRIKYYELDKNKGRGYARNYAISKCNGKYIAICDADDINLRDRIKMQVEFFEENSDIYILGTQMMHFSDTAKPKKVYHYPETPEMISRFFQKGIMGVAHASCMLRKECFKNHTYDDNMAYVEDFELFLRLNVKFKMTSLSQVLILYRNDLSQVSLEKIKYHTLYHHYSIYVASSKLKKLEFESFEQWKKNFQKSTKLQIDTVVSYSKIKIKELIRRLN